MANELDPGKTFDEKVDILSNTNTPAWVPLTLTLVEYPQGDTFGKLLAIISLMPFAIIAGFATLVLFRRDLHTIIFFFGIAVNEAVNVILKHMICESRPMRRDFNYTEYGMPSAHSQFMFFFSTYITLFLLIRLHHNNNSTFLERIGRISIIGACVSTAIAVTFSRVYLEYHTTSQVFCGTVVGITLGIIWFTFTHIVLTPFFPVIVSWHISEFLMIRDTTLIPNVLWFEYTNIRAEARARSRKLVSMKSQ